MNILPHKSWHVYNHKNRERVKQDEDKAAAGEKQNEERAIGADTKSKQGNQEYEAEAKAKQEKWNRTIAMHLDTGIKGKATWRAPKSEMIQ
ncbi:hypothetical protein BGZ65_009262 [Modicella reniformis]|uniref:CBF1-interacting co-repressor CIR N-terminal domain-containing protein n=1 Tax=Modicella reniformis TaxID=1440133 RepID=A0A9P6IML5_9FUNG|nr:hypothetical protein BGZ65_009262 [Modicella reniformis]